MIHITWVREVEKPDGVDLRTREGRDAEVVAQVREFGGFTVGWATDSIKRAHAIGRMEEAGLIRRQPNDGPGMWCRYEMAGGGSDE